MPITLDSARIKISEGAGIGAGSYAPPIETSFETEVARILKRILGTLTGNAIDTKIRTHGWLQIEPFPDQDSDIQAYTPETGGSTAVVQFTPYTLSARTSLRTGSGDSELRRSSFTSGGWVPGTGPDEILFHEMVHASRMLGGDYDDISLAGKMSAWDNEEDFFAILVANIYISEKGKSFASLRGAHDLTTHLSKENAKSEVFLHKDDNYRLIEKFCRQHPTIAPMIGRVKADFNPIRAYYEKK